MTVWRCATALAILSVSLVACERQEILSVDPEDAPGTSAATLETLLSPSDIGQWVDTVFPGFAGPRNSAFLLIDGGSALLTSRGLFRFENVQDSVFGFDTTSAALRFDSARVVLSVDTLRTRLATGGTMLRLLALEQEWDVRTANWEFAVDSPGAQVPWLGGPGGSLGQQLGETVVDEEMDSIIFELGAASDSLIRAWNDTMLANPGLALVVGDSGRLALRVPRLRYAIVPEIRPDTAFTLSSFAVRTYIFDQNPPPVAAGRIRVGGVQGWRSFTEFVLPDSVPVTGGQAALRGATINKAELLLTSPGRPAPPFAAEQPFFLIAFRLVDDFRVFGPKTPVGLAITNSVGEVVPDSLDADPVLAIDITTRVRSWSGVPADSVPLPIRLVIRSTDEATDFGYWEFGGVRDPAVAPVLRIVFTPPTDFRLP